MENVIIAATFVLGLAFGVVAVIALFTNRMGGEGSLKFAGLELTGRSAPIIFLFVATVMVMSGFGWAASNTERDDAYSEAATIFDKLENLRGEIQDSPIRIPAVILEQSSHKPSKGLEKVLNRINAP